MEVRKINVLLVIYILPLPILFLIYVLGEDESDEKKALLKEDYFSWSVSNRNINS